MNNLIRITGIVLLGSAMTMTSCKKKGCTDPLASNYSIEAKKDNGSCVYNTVTLTPSAPTTPSAIKALFLSNRNTDKQTFSIKTDRATQLIGTKGTKISIPKDAFVNSNGSIVTGNVTLEILEVINQSSMIWYGLPTMSNGNILESGGELMVKAFANGQELGLANGVKLAIQLPSDNNKPNMTLYYGLETKTEIGDVNWLLADSLGYDDSISYDSIVYCDTIYNTYAIYDTIFAPIPNNWQSNYPNPTGVWYDTVYNSTTGGTDTLSVSFATGESSTYFYLDCNNQTQTPDEGYDINFSSLGWINCDFLYLPTGNTSGLDVITPSDFTGANTEIYLHFSSVNAVADMEYSGSNLFETHYNGIPMGMQLTIVAISELNGTYYSSFTPITMTNNHSETITMNASTIADIQNAINSL